MPPCSCTACVTWGDDMVPSCKSWKCSRWLCLGDLEYALLEGMAAYGRLLLAPAEGWWPSATWRALRALLIQYNIKCSQLSLSCLYLVSSPSVVSTSTSVVSTSTSVVSTSVVSTSTSVVSTSVATQWQPSGYLDLQHGSNVKNVTEKGREEGKGREGEDQARFFSWMVQGRFVLTKTFKTLKCVG